MRRLALLAVLLSAVPALAAPRVRRKAPDMSFDRYVFAAIWQPGVCASVEPVSAAACGRLTPRSPEARAWTLHGLWADLPRGLAREGMKKGTWYKYGCYWFRPGHERPKTFCADPPLRLSPATARALDAEMPGRAGCLDRHEYNKHARCYGFEPDPFFRGALGLLHKLNASRFGAYVAARRGRTVARADLEKSFAEAFGLKDASALELRCSSRPGSKDEDVLTQAWITLSADGPRLFPKPAAFRSGRGGNCAERVLIAAPVSGPRGG
ncbi:MAG: ribonuclease I [Elusimicrobia bacterium]|nr:ribonuclease I [Elusimicrobiota bacterium]